MPLIRFETADGEERIEFPMGDNGLPRLMLSEVAHIQRVADLTIPQLMEGLAALDPTALAVLVQVMWKRSGRVVRFEDIDFDISTLDYSLLPGEDDAEDEEPLPEGAPDPTPASSGRGTRAG